MSPADKISMWHSKTGGMPFGTPPLDDPEWQENDQDSENWPLPPSSDSLGHEDAAQTETDQNTYEQYRECLVDSMSYKWLLEALKRQSLLSNPTPDVRGSIRRRIFNFLTPRTNTVSRKESSKTYRVTFQMEWDPGSFVEHQQYGIPPDEAITSAATITGTDQDTQALAPREYFQQTWQSSTVLLLAQSIARQGPAERCMASVTLEDETKVVMEALGSVIHVRVDGPVPSIADIGEQLAWIGAALRPSPSDEHYDGVWYCHPSIRCFKQAPIRPSGPAADAMDCMIQTGFRFSKYKGKGKVTNGYCWHDMFRNPVVVTGYPIARRHVPVTGLEAPLGGLSRLIRTDCITEFDGRTFIKGLSSTLALVERIRDMVLWHLFHNPRGERVSYLDCDTDRPAQTLQKADLENCRHVVGWCSNIKIYAGSPDGDYKIRTSGLQRPGPGCTLEKFAISGGNFISANVSFALGVRDTPLFHLTRSDYLEKLNWVSKRYIVFWDEESKRAWLVNGTTALLHLVRASLEYDKTNKTKPSHLFNAHEIKESDTPYTADSAIDVLKSGHNRNLKLAEDKTEEWVEGEIGKAGTPKFKTTYVFFQNRVESLYHILEKMIEYQIKIESRSGYDMKLRVRKYLEGWEFKALAKRDDPLYPVVKTLPTRGKGWVYFSRDLHAITLFGYGFGDLMLPTQPDMTTCTSLSQVPRDQHYLAVSLSDLNDIMENYDSPAMKLKMPHNMAPVSDSLVWHAPRPLFEQCQCRRQASLVSTKCKHSDSVQVLFPTRLRQYLQPREVQIIDQVERHISGAVIFGHSSLVKWWWRDQGDPESGDPPPAEDPIELEVYDSGIDTGNGNFSTQLTPTASTVVLASTAPTSNSAVPCSEPEPIPDNSSIDTMAPSLEESTNTASGLPETEMVGAPRRSRIFRKAIPMWKTLAGWKRKGV